MRVERIAKDKVRFFISYDELEERGIHKDEILNTTRKSQEFHKVRELFWDMMETAYAEAGFEIAGPIVVEAFKMPSEGVVLIVTRVPSLPGQTESEDDDVDEVDVELTAELFSSFVFSFDDFEDLVRCAHSLLDYGLDSTLYHYEDSYQLFVDEESAREDTYDLVWSILQEYGEYSNATTAILEEYATVMIRHHAIETIANKFPI